MLQAIETAIIHYAFVPHQSKSINQAAGSVAILHNGVMAPLGL